jgi:F-type H+-transporting ATPase subunit b
MIHDPAFWVAVAFGIFMFLVIKPAGKIVIKALDDRSEKIKKELDEAVRLKDEAQAILLSYQRKQKEALEEAENIVKNAKREAERMVKDAHDELEASLNKRVEMTMQKINTYENSIVNEIRMQAVDEAVTRAYTLLDGKLTAAANTNLIENSVAGLEGAKFN